MNAGASSTSWTEPGAFQVRPGVHRIPLPLPSDGLRAVNVYAIEHSQGVTLIDGGWAIHESRAQLESALSTLGYHPRDITSFMVTHAHRDHYTQAVAIRSEFGHAVVSLGLPERENLDLILDPGRGEDPFVARLSAAGAGPLAKEWADEYAVNDPIRDLWLHPDRWLDRDETHVVGSHTLHGLHTPGHTPGHFVFADLELGFIFSGDHILPSITPSIGFSWSEQGQPLGDFLASLVKVRGLPDLELLPAHGQPGMSSHARIDELLAHHDDRLEACLAVVGTQSLTAFEVASQLPWTRRERTFHELDVFNQGMACMETVAHLDLLAARGQLVATLNETGVGVYSRASAQNLSDSGGWVPQG